MTKIYDSNDTHDMNFELFHANITLYTKLRIIIFGNNINYLLGYFLFNDDHEKPTNTDIKEPQFCAD